MIQYDLQLNTSRVIQFAIGLDIYVMETATGRLIRAGASAKNGGAQPEVASEQMGNGGERTKGINHQEWDGMWDQIWESGNDSWLKPAIGHQFFDPSMASGVTKAWSWSEGLTPLPLQALPVGVIDCQEVAKQSAFFHRETSCPVRLGENMSSVEEESISRFEVVCGADEPIASWHSRRINDHPKRYGDLMPQSEGTTRIVLIEFGWLSSTHFFSMTMTRNMQHGERERIWLIWLKRFGGVFWWSSGGQMLRRMAPHFSALSWLASCSL